MYYIMIAQNVKDSGYETHYASSDNLVDWKYEGKILERNPDGKWDSKQIAGYVTFPDIEFGGSYEHQKVNGKYYDEDAIYYYHSAKYQKMLFGKTVVRENKVQV